MPQASRNANLAVRNARGSRGKSCKLQALSNVEWRAANCKLQEIHTQTLNPNDLQLAVNSVKLNPELQT